MSVKDIILVLPLFFIIICNILFYRDIECKNKYKVFNYITIITNLIIFTLLLFYLITRDKKYTKIMLLIIICIIILTGNLLAIIRKNNCEDNKTILVIEKIAFILAIIFTIIFIITFWLSVTVKNMLAGYYESNYVNTIKILIS